MLREGTSLQVCSALLPMHLKTSAHRFWTAQSHICARKARLTHTHSRSMPRTCRWIRRRKGQCKCLPVERPRHGSTIAWAPILEGALEGPGDRHLVLYQTGLHGSRTRTAILEGPGVM